MTVDEIAGKIGGTVIGDGAVELTGLAGLKEAGTGDISFLSSPRYASLISETDASAVIVNEDYVGDCACAVIKVKNADEAFAKVAMLIGPEPVGYEPGIHPTAVVSEKAVVGDDVYVGPNCVIEPEVKIGARTVVCAGCYLGHGTVVGEDCRFYPLVSMRENTSIGDRVIIHNGAVIGSDGFGYVKNGEAWDKIPQIGIVEIGNDVEIGANVTIDRARFGKTVIGNGVKLDNLVQVAHNVKIGDNTAMAAQVAIAGSTTIGKNVQIGGQAGVTGHVAIDDNTVVAGGAGVTKDITPAGFVSGFPAIPHKKATRMHAHMMRIPALKKQIKELEERIDNLEKGGSN